MSDATVKQENDATHEQEPPAPTQVPKPAWETPEMQDVSEEVMAQPYIRFT